MTQIAVILDSDTGRTLSLGLALAEGARAVPGTLVSVARINPGSAVDGAASLPVATPDMLAAADGIALGTPIHLGAPSAAMMAYLATTGGLWQQGTLAGRVATVFAGAGSGGGSEMALASLWSVLAVHGLIILPGSPRAGAAGGGSPMGAVALAGSDPAGAAGELARARAQGAQLARVAQALAVLR